MERRDPTCVRSGPARPLAIVPRTVWQAPHPARANTADPRLTGGADVAAILVTVDDPQILSVPERRTWMTGTQHEADLDWLRGLLLRVLPGLLAEEWSTKPCLIPDTPTKLPYLEIVEPGLVMAVGSNGYAAKSADAIGALAAGLVVNGRWTDPQLDEQSFKLITRA